MTHDISKAGTFVETTTWPPVGTRVKVVVAIAGGSKEEMHVRLGGVGEVRHVRNDKEPLTGFGAWVSFHTEGSGSAED